ncbi:hypothetical protein GDO78_021474 [Eleutherodactylus coqui]|uniref:Uncharacterized protein n=1 Tax=Eleutherodactylus coqui TaxID=57060 RepID=A0A8J6BIW4_ELECQ|nr:hypothetical protein GDO78_021474 [Eleutherodactylus coqui]
MAWSQESRQSSCKDLNGTTLSGNRQRVKGKATRSMKGIPPSSSPVMEEEEEDGKSCASGALELRIKANMRGTKRSAKSGLQH